MANTTFRSDPLGDAAASLVNAAKALAEASKTRENTPVYYDQFTAPCGQHAFKAAAKKRAFPTFRVGKRLLARTEDVHGWIERHQVVEQPADDVDAALLSGGVEVAP